MNIKEYIRQLQSYEVYAFNYNELCSKTNKTPAAIKNELSRLSAKNEIFNLRKEFYVIFPPQYAVRQYLPLQFYVDKLFSFLQKPYYVGLFSAAKFYGAAHQQLQTDYIITTPPPLAEIKKKSFHIKFFTASRWPSKNIRKMKSDAGFFRISSPALTIADLIHYQTKLGGINRIFTVIKELTGEVTAKDLEELLEWYPYVSTLQRFGFLLEKSGAGKPLVDSLKNHLEQRKLYPVLLSPSAKKRSGKTANFWKVIENTKLESDL